MEEGRGAKYGRFLAGWVRHTINTIPEPRREEYKERFIAELKKYSFEPRKKGEPMNSGCVRELDMYDDLDVEDPECLARTLKEGRHLNYQKGTSLRIVRSLLEHL